MTTLARLASVGCAAGALGLLGGAHLERRRHQEALALPWLPPPMLRAATATAPHQLAPAVTPAEVAVPPKDLAGIPPAPPRGISRTAEIMRFGFPGLDNIRSHR